MSNYIRIAGNPATGIVLLGDDGAVRSLGQVEPAGAWVQSPQAAGFVPGVAAFACLIGDGAGFVTAAHGTAIRYLSVLGQPNARWKDVASPPAGTGIAGLAGGPLEGYLLLAADGRLHRLDGGPGGGSNAWQACSAPPFSGKATLVAGNWQHGMLAVHDDGVAKLARSGTGDAWTALPAPPFAIEMVTGNFQDGFIACGEGQLYMLDTGAQPRWSRLAMPGFDLRALSGDPAHGVAAVLADSSGDGTLVAYALRPGKGPWSLALAPPARRA
ncbi:hypothetical protein ACQ4WQ_09205 [Janthinobacterium sp. GB1R12]|uniref:hypothetical protein n=1 Tax=Janthinobacterium sp. GB1R12 TaxID=3424190 RepID=UPI003F1E5D6B